VGSLERTRNPARAAKVAVSPSTTKILRRFLLENGRREPTRYGNTGAVLRFLGRAPAYWDVSLLGDRVFFFPCEWGTKTRVTYVERAETEVRVRCVRAAGFLF
jgi:hypothetical protein